MLSKFLPSYFVDKFKGNDVKQLQLMPRELYLKVLNGTDLEAHEAIDTFIEQQRRGGVRILEATVELLSDLHFQAGSQGKER